MSCLNSVKKLWPAQSQWKWKSRFLTCPKSVYQFLIAESQENDQSENLYISSHEEASNI